MLSLKFDKSLFEFESISLVITFPLSSLYSVIAAMFLRVSLSFASSNTTHATWTVWMSSWLVFALNAFNFVSFNFFVVIVDFPFTISILFKSLSEFTFPDLLKSETFKLLTAFGIWPTVVLVALFGNVHWLSTFTLWLTITPKPAGM